MNISKTNLKQKYLELVSGILSFVIVSFISSSLFHSYISTQKLLNYKENYKVMQADPVIKKIEKSIWAKFSKYEALAIHCVIALTSFVAYTIFFLVILRRIFLKEKILWGCENQIKTKES